MRYKLLGRTGLKVSELCLGTMTFGLDWGWGASKEESRRLFDAYVHAGGNFIDTAVNYTNGTSEAFVGEFVASDREHFVIATKYSLMTRPDDPNSGGNSRKTLVRSLEKSLKRLGTDCVDLYLVHIWDKLTPIAEIMRALDDVVRAGKALYVGISDTPAWVVAQANTMADLRGWSPFVALQIPYSLAWRDAERDLLPMARALDLAVMAWAVVGTGVLTGKFNRGTNEPTRANPKEVSPEQLALADAVCQVAAELGRSPAQVAINWVRQQQSRAEIIPILGARNESQLLDNLGALGFTLDPGQLSRLEQASRFKPGFPNDFGGYQYIHRDLASQIDNHRP